MEVACIDDISLFFLLDYICRSTRDDIFLFLKIFNLILNDDVVCEIILDFTDITDIQIS
jgi:hypothetical protein